MLGVGFHPVDIGAAVEILITTLRSGLRVYVCHTGVRGIMAAQKSKPLRRVLNEAYLNVAESMSAVWIGRRQGFGDMGRVHAPDLMAAICEISIHNEYRHFFLSDDPVLLETLQTRLTRRFPGLKVAGSFTVRGAALSREDDRRLIEEVARTRPDFLWVGMETPFQEEFMARHLNRLKVKIMVGVGEAFRIHSQRLKDAPYWMKESGLVWLHRLAQQPRLLLRCLVQRPRFLIRVVGQLWGLKKYSLETEPPETPTG